MEDPTILKVRSTMKSLKNIQQILENQFDSSGKEPLETSVMKRKCFWKISKAAKCIRNYSIKFLPTDETEVNEEEELEDFHQEYEENLLRQFNEGKITKYKYDMQISRMHDRQENEDPIEHPEDRLSYRGFFRLKKYLDKFQPLGVPALTINMLDDHESAHASSTNPVFIYENIPMEGWRKEVLIRMGGKARGYPEVLYSLSSQQGKERHKKRKFRSREDITAHFSKLNQPQTPDVFDFGSVFCVCHNLEDKSRDYLECSFGKAGCNGWLHPECVGLGYLSREEFQQLNKVICPFCTCYLEGSGELSKAVTTIQNLTLLRQITIPEVHRNKATHQPISHQDKEDEIKSMPSDTNFTHIPSQADSNKVLIIQASSTPHRFWGIYNTAHFYQPDQIEKNSEGKRSNVETSSSNQNMVMNSSMDGQNHEGSEELETLKGTQLMDEDQLQFNDINDTEATQRYIPPSQPRDPPTIDHFDHILFNNEPKKTFSSLKVKPPRKSNPIPPLPNPKRNEDEPFASVFSHRLLSNFLFPVARNDDPPKLGSTLTGTYQSPNKLKKLPNHENSESAKKKKKLTDVMNYNKEKVKAAMKFVEEEWDGRKEDYQFSRSVLSKYCEDEEKDRRYLLCVTGGWMKFGQEALPKSSLPDDLQLSLVEDDNLISELVSKRVAEQRKKVGNHVVTLSKKLKFNHLMYCTAITYTSRVLPKKSLSKVDPVDAMIELNPIESFQMGPVLGYLPMEDGGLRYSCLSSKPYVPKSYHAACSESFLCGYCLSPLHPMTTTNSANKRKSVFFQELNQSNSTSRNSSSSSIVFKSFGKDTEYALHKSCASMLETSTEKETDSNEREVEEGDEVIQTRFIHKYQYNEEAVASGRISCAKYLYRNDEKEDAQCDLCGRRGGVFQYFSLHSSICHPSFQPSVEGWIAHVPCIHYLCMNSIIYCTNITKNPEWSYYDTSYDDTFGITNKVRKNTKVKVERVHEKPMEEEKMFPVAEKVISVIDIPICAEKGFSLDNNHVETGAIDDKQQPSLFMCLMNQWRCSICGIHSGLTLRCGSVGCTIRVHPICVTHMNADWQMYKIYSCDFPSTLLLCPKHSIKDEN